MAIVWSNKFTFDPDAAAYISAVEAADEAASPGIGALETGVRYAINDFVRGCKQDGIWSAIKASCILAGARTLPGALVSLVGPAPTNVSSNFATADYDRKTGLKGSGTSKHLDTNYAGNNQTASDRHCAVYLGAAGNGDGSLITAGNIALASSGFDSLDRFSGAYRAASMAGPSFAGIFSAGATATQPGLIGMSRDNQSSFVRRIPGTSETTLAFTAQAPQSLNFLIFTRRYEGSQPNFSTDARIAFYSIGEALDLQKLDARVTDLVNAIGVAIP